MRLDAVKHYATSVPFPLGAALARVPYGLRPFIGREYRRQRTQLRTVEQMSDSHKVAWALERLRIIVASAYRDVPFYRFLYSQVGFEPGDLQSLEDFGRLPVVAKADLQSVELGTRSCSRPGSFLVNTGGSSGRPLELYVEGSCIAREWAHMHDVWANVGFKQRDNKVSFGGRSDIDGPIVYDGLRHQFSVNLYTGWPMVADALERVAKRTSLTFLHGYPSAIFDFILWLEAVDHPLLALLRRQTESVLLGSELPSPELRRQVCDMLGCESVSWFGHTERAILARERMEPGRYEPYFSYGFAEAIANAAGADSRLIVTSYANDASPLIRYDTGDLVRPQSATDALLTSFQVSAGRASEHILDASGNTIFLTGLIFGRHHALFDIANSVQVAQDVQGHAEIIVVPRHGRLSDTEAKAAFDARNVDIQFDFHIVDSPVRTSRGKVPLLISYGHL